jgi:hypothetical protein
MLPRAVGYASALIDYFFRGYLAVEYKEQTLKIWGSAETMAGDFQLLYDDSKGIRREVTSWTALHLEADQSSQALAAPRLPDDAALNAPCWLVFRGQLGLEAGAVVGSQVPCPGTQSSPPPAPPQTGPWVVYSCIYSTGGPDIRYNYATSTPVWDSAGYPLSQFIFTTSSGQGVCSIVAVGLPTQPPNTVTSNPS